ncbi:MAG: ATP-binding protein [Thermodesulfobacteriota bacterium]|nr:ATP-binding protein [Thermodesulfobacteriota bacterium]
MEALNEILLNALESFRDNQGSIDIVVYQDSNGLYITISDNGTGITEREKPYIFDPFFSTKAVGVGMGLCKAHRIIAEHNGEIAVDSHAHDGTTVTIRLPTRTVSESQTSVWV